MSAIDPQEFGRLQAQVEGLRRDTDRQTETLGRIEARMQSIEDKLTEARGGWKMLLAMGSAVATVGGGIGWALSHFSQIFGRGPT